MRRKHKRMELVRLADRHKHALERSSDEVFISRRTLMFKGAAVLGFGTLLARLGQMQLANASAFQTQAEGNIIRPEPLNGARGLIIDRKNRPLAMNRISWSVSLVPAQVPDDPDQLRYLRKQLIATLGLKDQLVVRKSGLPLGAESDVLAGLGQAIGQDPAKLTQSVLGSPDALVVVKADLDPAEVARYGDLDQRFPGSHVMNWLDYILKLHAGDATPIVISKDVSRDVALALQDNALYLPGVQVSDQQLQRQYPAGPELAHVLGYVGPISQKEYEKARADAQRSGEQVPAYLGTDYVGRGGLEESLEQELRGIHGLRWVQADARGVEIGELYHRRQDARPGFSAQISIDQEFQRAVTAALQDGINKANDAAVKAQKDPVGAGVAIAMNPQTGEILSMVSLPNYDNQKFADGISQADYQAYLNNSFKPLTNFAVSGEFPPGSPIKPLLACGALTEGPNNGGIDAGTQYHCAGSIRVPDTNDEAGGHTYVCWYHPGHGTLDIRHALSQSCDIYFYNVGAPGQEDQFTKEPLHYYEPNGSKHYFQGLGIDKIGLYLREQFGFGQPTGIELAGEASGRVPDAKWMFQTLHEYWSVGDTINVSIGQGQLSCTPLQLLGAIAAIANGGTYYQPRLVQRLIDAGGKVVREYAPVTVRRLAFDPDHIATVREGMRMTVSDPMGTAHGKFVLTGNDFPIAGKTGTAEFGQAENGVYAKSHAWFTCFAPFDKPEIAVVVLIQGGGEGATFAVPVADAILAAYFGKSAPKG